jgi:Holliday junction resolvase RusA-like endonuclease
MTLAERQYAKMLEINKGDIVTTNKAWAEVFTKPPPMDHIKYTTPRVTSLTIELEDTDYWSTNNLYMTVNGKRILKPLARSWKESTVRKISKHKNQLLEAKKYKVELHIYSIWLNQDSSVRKKDLDNAAKLALDALASGLGFEDSQIWTLKLEKHHSYEPRIIFKIKVLEV